MKLYLALQLLTFLQVPSFVQQAALSVFQRACQILSLNLQYLLPQLLVQFQ